MSPRRVWIASQFFASRAALIVATVSGTPGVPINLNVSLWRTVKSLPSIVLYDHLGVTSSVMSALTPHMSRERRMREAIARLMVTSPTSFRPKLSVFSSTSSCSLRGTYSSTWGRRLGSACPAVSSGCGVPS